MTDAAQADPSAWMWVGKLAPICASMRLLCSKLPSMGNSMPTAL